MVFCKIFSFLKSYLYLKSICTLKYDESIKVFFTLKIMQKTYVRDITVLFIVKLILLTGIFFISFSLKDRPVVDSSQMSKHIL